MGQQNFTQYTLIYVALDGNVLTEEAKLNIKRSSGGKVVETMAMGFAGVSQGSPIVTGSVSNMIPLAGLEFDAGPYIASLTPISMKVVLSNGLGMVFQAVILDDDASHGVGQAAGYSFNFIGTLDINSYS